MLKSISQRLYLLALLIDAGGEQVQTGFKGYKETPQLLAILHKTSIDRKYVAV